MGERTAVALLFDDADLGGQLREALRERGADIVHEGSAREINQSLLDTIKADVLVVNLDDSGDDALDQLYEVIDGDRLRVVFNDAQASRALEGWDKARWARHLAAKVLAERDIDPPRPEMADEPAISEPTAYTPPAGAINVADQPAFVEGVAATALPPPATPEPRSANDDAHASPSSDLVDDLEAELQALLAADDEQRLEQGFNQAFERAIGGGDRDERRSLPALSADDFTNAGTLTFDDLVEPVYEEPPAATPSELTLEPFDQSIASAPSEHSPRDASTTDASSLRPHDTWQLLDVDATPSFAPAPEKVPSAADFGIEKLSALDYLAPVEPDETDEEASMSLQRESLEEAMAPRSFEPIEGAEALPARLDTLDHAALDKVVVLGATAGATDAVTELLARLPAGMRCAFVLVQHLDNKPMSVLIDSLSRLAAMPLRVASAETPLRHGEWVVVPASQQLQLGRDGRMALQSHDAGGAANPSIDASFSTIANVFGRDALAILFSGPSTDAVAGCQAIHDRGGRVWVEQSNQGDPFDDMVSGVVAERLMNFSGTPDVLASQLIEHFSMETRP